MVDPNRLWRGALNEIAPGVWYLPIVMANVYFLGEKNGPWVSRRRRCAWRWVAHQTGRDGDIWTSSGVHYSDAWPFRSCRRSAATRREEGMCQSTRMRWKRRF